MAGRVAGKVALVTGAARSQGRSHAVRLAQEGADIIGLDLCGDMDTVPYGLSTEKDLMETVAEVEALDRRMVAIQADVRDFAAMRTAVGDGVAQLGRLDIVSANAGISSIGRLETLDERTWQDVLDVDLTGVWHTAKAAIPHLRQAGGGSIIMTNSTAGLRGLRNIGHYAAAKHGLVGLMRSLALELGADHIRVNSIHPGCVDTVMIHNDPFYALFVPDVEESARTREVVGERTGSMNALPVPWVEAIDISNALLWFASDESRYVTGVSLPVDAGRMLT